MDGWMDGFEAFWLEIGRWIYWRGDEVVGLEYLVAQRLIIMITCGGK
jgi:hypothetical protein